MNYEILKVEGGYVWMLDKTRNVVVCYPIEVHATAPAPTVVGPAAPVFTPAPTFTPPTASPVMPPTPVTGNPIVPMPAPREEVKTPQPTFHGYTDANTKVDEMPRAPSIAPSHLRGVFIERDHPGAATEERRVGG